MAKLRSANACMRLDAPRQILLLWIAATLLTAGGVAQGQEAQELSEHPVPILTGSAGYFTNVTAGENALVPGGPYSGQVEKSLDYLQLDYIANPYLTITAGRFLTPFGIYNERLYPIWIRDLQTTPLIFPIATGSSDGMMLRGGFPLSSSVNLNYATYFSAASTLPAFESDRTAGGRIGFFFSRPRIEIGTSWQKLLQDERTQSEGFHFAWQPSPVPLNLRFEYARGQSGSGYWVEGAYRLSQVRVWNSAMRRTEFVGRMQQFFAGVSGQGSNTDSEYQLPHSNVQQPDFGLNYYLKDGLKASASYGRWLGKHNYNIWSFGVAYRFAVPLGRLESQ